MVLQVGTGRAGTRALAALGPLDELLVPVTQQSRKPHSKRNRALPSVGHSTRLVVQAVGRKVCRCACVLLNDLFIKN